MTAHELTIRRTTADDWREVRALRLEMIRDTPKAYVETLETAQSHDEAEWRMRGARGSAEHGIAIAAIDASGRWVATMGGFVPDVSTGPLLVGVYVTPSHRGTSVAADLLATIETWARGQGDFLLLHVHEQNPRAIGFYERSGYERTGVTVPYVLDSSQLELEMVKRF